MNALKTAFLMALLFALFIFIGGLIGGKTGMIIAFFLALTINLISFWFSDRIVLSTMRAVPASERDYPYLHRIVANLSERIGIPKPRIYIVPTNHPNAFATGKNPQNAAVAVTSGLLKLLDEDEIEGVIGHELMHIKNRDTLISTIAASIAGAIMLLANWARWSFWLGGLDDREDRGAGLFALLLIAILAPIAALLIQMAISRTREYSADEGSARATRKPRALASALEKIAYGAKKLPLQVNPECHHLFIVQPISGDWIASLFSTHPPVRKRIERLLKLERELYLR